MSNETPDNAPQAPEPGSAEDWATPDPGERRIPEGQADLTPEQEENAVLEGDDTPDPPKAEAKDDDDPIGQDDTEDEADDGPEFWSKEDKAFWKNVPPEMRPILRKYEQQRIEFANKKAEEAAGERKAAMEAAAKAADAGKQFAEWLEANGPTFHKTFVDRWAGVDWNTLATENPAEWARLSQMRANEHAQLTQAAALAQKGREEANARAVEAHQEARKAEHAKLAAKFPKEFGTPEAAKRAYETLSKFLVERGIAPERVGAIYEAPIVEIVRDAYKYRQIQATAKGITNPKSPEAPASTTPTRVVPGARSGANQYVNNAVRQAEERLRSGGRSGPEVADAFR